MSDPDLINVNVEIESPSMLFKHSTEIEVRDSELNLLKTTMPGTVKLPEGLYEFSAVLESGQRANQVVHVNKGHAPASVRLGFQQGKEKLPGSALEDMDQEQKKEFVENTQNSLASRIKDFGVLKLGHFIFRDGYQFAGLFSSSNIVESVSLFLEGFDDTKITNLDAEVLSYEHVTMKSIDGHKLTFVCEQELSEVPSVKVRLAGKVVEISLPCSFQEPPSNLCTLNLEEVDDKPIAIASVAPQRTVASAIQNMMIHGHIFKAQHLVEDANELLLYKYQDSVAAALGGIVLSKFNMLRQRISWVKNLAGSFSWLPDGKVLLATLYAESSEELGKARTLAIEASKQRFLYTETYSLLLRLLRHWPDREQDEALQGAFEKVAGMSAYVDWSSVYFTNIVNEED